MIFLTWIKHGLAEALWPATLAGDKKHKSPWPWTVHFIVLVGVLGLLAYLNGVLDLERSLRSPWPGLHRAWLPVLFTLLYAVLWLLFCLGKLLAVDTKVGHFPDIDEAWSEALIALQQARIDIRNLPVYLVLGRPAVSADTPFDAAGTRLLPKMPRRNNSPLHVHTFQDGLFVTCPGASLLGRQASHLVEVGLGDGPSWSAANAPAEAERQSSRSQAQSREMMDLYLARLHHLCRLLARARGTSCAVNGLLMLIPLAASNNTAESRQTGRFCQLDLQTLRTALRVDCPIYVMACDLEKTPGWAEFAATLPREQCKSLACRFPLLPDLEFAEAQAMVADGIKHLMQARLQSSGCALLELEENGDGEVRTSPSGSRNERIVGFLAQMHGRAEPLARLVTGALYSTAASYPMVGGFYMAATGGDREQTVIADLFKDMAKNQNVVAWTAAALAEERRYRRLARAILAAALVLGAVLLVGSFLVFS